MKAAGSAEGLAEDEAAAGVKDFVHYEASSSDEDASDDSELDSSDSEVDTTDADSESDDSESEDSEASDNDPSPKDKDTQDAEYTRASKVCWNAAPSGNRRRRLHL